MKYLLRFLSIVFLSCVFSWNANAQTDPAAREDAAIERQRMMKAVDQIEILSNQIDKMQDDLQSTKQELESLKTENYKLKQQIALDEMRRTKEREVILAEVSKQIAKVSKISAPPPSPEKSSEEKIAPSKASEKGYEHIVEKGQTLWLISKAYKEKGVDVSVDDIRKANNMKSGTPLKIGQKLFIPAK